jgi:ATP-dependent DNA ligase
MLMRSPLARERRSPAGFIRPAQPVLADRPPTGPGWSFEIKHDGFRIVSRKDGERVRLWSRNARDWSPHQWRTLIIGASLCSENFRAWQDRGSG